MKIVIKYIIGFFIVILALTYFVFGNNKENITFNVSRQIDGEITYIWHKLSNIGDIAKFHPNVEKSYIIGNIKTGLGSRAIWEFYDNKGQVTEEITQFIEKKSFSVKYIEGSLPVSFAETSFILSDAKNNNIKIDIEMQFKMKGGMFGEAFGNLIMKKMMKERMENFISALEFHIKTGKKIDTSS